MLILGLESSAAAASAALVRDGSLIAEYRQICGLTHSRTLLPMAESLLKNTETDIGAVDLVAVSRGPGSFTGIRIGVSTVKGLCWAAEKPAAGVSTLAAMAWNGAGRGENTLICCCMDARRSQIYNSLSAAVGGRPLRVTPDRALSLPELSSELRGILGRELSLKDESGAGISVLPERIFLVGDGAALCYNYFSENGIPCELAPDNIRHQSAWGVCKEAERTVAARGGLSSGEFDAAGLLPVYLRLSQAERERQARMNTDHDKGEINL